MEQPDTGERFEESGLRKASETTKRMKAIVVDDERLARSRLKNLLEKYDWLEVVAEASGVEEAARVVERFCPDVIFLDVQMPGGSGFTLFDRCRVVAEVIFVTAWDDYALRAFEVNALDYLLKPVDPARLEQSLKRLAGSDVSSGRGQIRPLKSGDRVAFREKEGMRFVAAGEIAYLKSADDYSEIHLCEGDSALSDDTLAWWENRLEPIGFIRVHRQFIVNVSLVERLVKSGDTVGIVLKDADLLIPVARRRVRKVKEVLLERQ